MEFKDDGIANTLTQEQLGQMTDEQIEEMATAYSEGNSGLKELLKYCAKYLLLHPAEDIRMTLKMIHHI